MTSTVTDPQHWSLPDPKNVIALPESRRQGKITDSSKGSHWIFSKDITPVDLYAYLKLRFGPPNGFAMTLRSPSVDNLIHWNWTLECPDSVIDIIGLDTYITVRTRTIDLDRSEWGTLEINLLDEFKRHRNALADIRQTFEKWRLFVNPYRRLSSIVDRYERRLNDVVIPQVQPPSIPVTKEQMNRYVRDMKSALDFQQEAQALCVSLEMISPVMGEAAVNLLMLLSAKTELRNDRRLMERFCRDHIDVRVKSLHLHCDGFRQAVSATDDRFKEFLRIMDRRNDTLHGAVDPRRDFGEVFYFDQQNILLPPIQKNLGEMALTYMMADLSTERSFSSVNIVRKFVELLVESLEPDKATIFRRVMDESLLGYEAKTGRIGVILPTARVEFYPGDI